MIESFEFFWTWSSSSISIDQLMLQSISQMGRLDFPPFRSLHVKGFTARLHASKQKNWQWLQSLIVRGAFLSEKIRQSCGISTQQFHFFYLNHCSTFKWSKCSRDQWHLWQPTVADLCDTTATTDRDSRPPWRSERSQGGEGFSSKDSDTGEAYSVVDETFSGEKHQFSLEPVKSHEFSKVGYVIVSGGEFGISKNHPWIQVRSPVSLSHEFARFYISLKLTYFLKIGHHTRNLYSNFKPSIFWGLVLGISWISHVFFKYFQRVGKRGFPSSLGISVGGTGGLRGHDHRWALQPSSGRRSH